MVSVGVAGTPVAEGVIEVCVGWISMVGEGVAVN